MESLCQLSNELVEKDKLIKRIDDALSYAATLVGIKYKWWYGQDLLQDGSPLWVGIGEVKRSDIKSCGCTGFLNLIRRKYDLNVPGISDKDTLFPGGLQVWIDYLLSRSIEVCGQTEQFETNKHYQRGSLLVRPKMNHNDSGHIAIIYTDDDKTNPLNNKLIHSYPSSDELVFHSVGPGVVIESIEYSHGLLADGVYKYVFPPGTWLK